MCSAINYALQKFPIPIRSAVGTPTQQTIGKWLHPNVPAGPRSLCGTVAPSPAMAPWLRHRLWLRGSVTLWLRGSITSCVSVTQWLRGSVTLWLRGSVTSCSSVAPLLRHFVAPWLRHSVAPSSCSSVAPWVRGSVAVAARLTAFRSPPATPC